jgi:hypothetical protein
MKIELTGWRRQIHHHSHPVTPVSRFGTNLYPIPELKDAKWEDALTISGKVQGLALNGDFYLRCKFTETELQAWFLEYAKSNPREAKKLIGRAHNEMRGAQGGNE